MSALGSNVTPMLGQTTHPRAIDRETAAQMLGVSCKTVEREINRGHIQAFKIGTQWRIMLRDLETYIAQQKEAQRRRVGA